MENKSTQIDQTVLLDRKMIIEGVQYHEKTIERVLQEDGVELSISSHLRPSLHGQSKLCEWKSSG